MKSTFGSIIRSTVWRKIVICVLAGVLLFAGCSPAAGSSTATTTVPPANADGGATTTAQPAKSFTSKIATGALGGSSMTLGNTIAEYIKDYNITLSVEPGSTGGNVITVNNGDNNYGITAATSVSSGRVGNRMYEQYGVQDNVYMLASFYKYYFRALTINPAINTYEDIRGKRVGMGAAGGETYEYTPIVLEYFGINEGDYTVVTMSWAETVEAMKNGQVDVMVSCGPVPYGIYDDLAMTSNSAHALQLPEEAAKYLDEKWPGYPYVSYDLDDLWAYEQPQYTPYQQNMLVCNGQVSEEEAYLMTKMIYERFEDLSNVIVNLKQSGRDGLADNASGLPVHPGAVKFYKEVGLM